MISTTHQKTVAFALPIEDDERHVTQVDDYIARNREALNHSIRRARREVVQGKVSTKTIADIIADGREGHASRS